MRALHQTGGRRHAHGAGIYRQPRPGAALAGRRCRGLRVGPSQRRRSAARPSGARWRAARSARPACPGRAARRRRGRPAAAPAAALDALARQRARAQQHRHGRASSRRSPTRCRRAQAPPSSTSSVVAELVGARAPRVVGLTRPKRFALGAATPGTPRRGAPPRAARAPPDAPGSAGRCVAWPPAAAVGHAGRARHDQRQRAGPEGLRSGAARPAATSAANCAAPRAASATCTISGWSAGPALGGEDLRHRRVVVGARAQAVDGLGREGDQLAGGQRAGAARLDRPSRHRAPSSSHGAAVSERRRCRAAARPAAPRARAASAIGRGDRQVAHLAARAARSALPYRCRCAPGSASTSRPVRRRRAAPSREPQVAEQVEHHRRRVLARRDQRQRRPARAPAARTARRRRRRCCSGRELCGRGAISLATSVPSCEDEELDAQHADVVERLRRCARAAAIGLRLQRRRRRRAPAPASRPGCRRGAGSAAPAGARSSPSRAARDDDADLGGQRQPLLEHAGHAAERGPGGGQLGAVGDPRLALAVVAEARGLQDAGQQRVGDARRAARRVSITACGAQGTPLRTNCAFSSARSWQTATAVGGRRHRAVRASVRSAAAGTFSNSVVIAAQRCISCARPCSSR